MKCVRFAMAWFLCAPALLMPYRVRVAYGAMVAAAAHAPFVLFGRLARVLLRALGQGADGEER